MILALGFAGGVGALVPMGLNYGVTISRDDAIKYVYGFRESNEQLVPVLYGTTTCGLP